MSDAKDINRGVLGVVVMVRAVARRKSLLCLLLAGFTAAGSALGARTLSGKQLEPLPREVLMEILAGAELSAAKVTAVTRTPERQAKVMYEICNAPDGVERAREMYSKGSLSVIDVYVDNRRRPRDKVVALMANEIRRVIDELGPQRRTLKHVSEEVYAIDIDPPSVADRARFEAEVSKHPDVSRWLPPADSGHDAYHLEIPRTIAAISGVWRGKCEAEDGERRGKSDGSEKSAPAQLELRRVLDGYQGALRFGGRRQRVSEVKVDKRRYQLSFVVADAPAISARFTKSRSAMKFSFSGRTCLLSKPLQKAQTSPRTAVKARAATKKRASKRRAAKQQTAGKSRKTR